jgi:hypothetical protein
MLSERQLWTAVLGLAFDDLRNKNMHNRARLWFTSNNSGPGSFRWICENLELNARAIRRAALRTDGARVQLSEDVSSALPSQSKR